MDPENKIQKLSVEKLPEKERGRNNTKARETYIYNAVLNLVEATLPLSLYPLYSMLYRLKGQERTDSEKKAVEKKEVRNLRGRSGKMGQQAT